jgi:hypothetical protein
MFAEIFQVVSKLNKGKQTVTNITEGINTA